MSIPGDVVYRMSAAGGDGVPGRPSAAVLPARWRPGAAQGIALWVFTGVATTLFTLFIVAYAMRMDSEDWSPIAMPGQLWLSSALLAAGSIVLQQASGRAHAGVMDEARQRLWAGGALATAFLVVQSWAWAALLTEHVTPTGNPAGSFFYVLTALHALHVLGGLVGWAVVARRAALRVPDPLSIAWRITLCARYWHFLFLVWVALFAALGWMTPEFVRFICGR